MKLGILTWFFGNNYGAKLHPFALQETLRSMGHDVSMINYHVPKAPLVNLFINLEYSRKKALFHPFTLVKCLNKCRKFDRWTKSSFTISRKVTTAGGINSLGFDAIIIGSDEVFNYKHPFFSELYYGAGLDVPLIAYAPSSGAADTGKILDDGIIASLRKFRRLSARDYATLELLRNNGLADNAPVVLDPTLLYDFTFSEKPRSLPQGKFLLSYTFSKWDNLGPLIRSHAKSKKLRVVSVGGLRKWADWSCIDASVPEWLWLFQNASSVFTDSFHGVVFCLKYRKPFVMVSRPDKTNKIDGQLSLLGIKKTFWQGDSPYDDGVDYSGFDGRLEAAKSASIDYLEDALRRL